ncbi:MAG: asparaginase [Crocinitomicaceae bacterium]|jgi:L-asparaginase|nr:asparaginase [Crocinitomicaceae bacterium]
MESHETSKSRVLVIYTGGTIGSVQDASGGLVPLDFNEIHRHVPELEQPNREIEIISFEPPLDSSNVGTKEWLELAQAIKHHYADFDGFVILHGTDTLAFTASALSFMLEGLRKPIILTGSQLPIGLPRTDGRENLLAAVDIATSTRFNEPIVQEVAVYFGSFLFRGNRAHKASAESMQAIISPNLPALAEAGVDIIYNESLMYRDSMETLHVHEALDNRVAWLPFFPGQPLEVIERLTDWPDLRGLVLSTFGSGNAPSNPALKSILTAANDRGISIVNVTQCGHGAVHPERYATAHLLRDCGVIPGGDMTTEAALTKLMACLGRGFTREEARNFMARNVRGELTRFSALT